MPTPPTDPQSAAMTDAELADLRARVATASAEGTWAHQCMGSEGCIIHIPADSVRTRRPHIARFGHGEWVRDHANAEYVADLHAAMPRLLDEMTRLRAESEQRLGELLFWEFEYRAAMDNYKGEVWQVGQLRTELADTAMMRDFNQRSAEHIAAKRDLAEAAIAAWDRDEISGDAAVLMIRKALADGPTAPACSCRAEAVHQAGCNTDQHA